MVKKLATAFVLGGAALLAVAAETNSTPEALDPQLTPLIKEIAGAPLLHYNGSGPVPAYNLTSPIPTPITPLTSSSEIEDNLLKEILGIVNGPSVTDGCTQCIMGTELMHFVAITQPVSTVTNLLIRACNAIPAFQDTIYAKTCYEEFSGIGGLGPYWAQLFSKMSMATGDMQAFCYFEYSVCDIPPTIEINESEYFSPKPASADAVPEPCGQSIDVLHLSDWHLDPRYDIGSEANCSQYLCCRPYATNTDLDTTAANASIPASRFGYLYCDSPPDLALSSFTSMPKFFNTADIKFAIFTGDIVSHDNDDQLSRAYISYEEEVTYQTFKAYMGKTPVYPTLGNHDSLPEAYNPQNSLDPTSSLTSNALGWNYELLSSMWEKDGWVSASEAQYAKTHYGAYAHTTAEGLRIISINTDFWYNSNVFNFWNFTNPDTSGVLRFLADELTVCEAKGQRAWVIGHVLSGYDGTQSLSNPTALFYSIVRRFSPSTIAGIFFGHTHEDQLQIFYDYLPNSTHKSANGSTIRNTTLVDYSKPLQVAFIGPSITPLTGNNAGYQRYQIDERTFSVTGIQTYFANVSDSLNWVEPEWQFEYDARTTYNTQGINWPSAAPLNATFWHKVTDNMLKNQTLVEIYNLFETKSAVDTANCSTKACAAQKVCYIRSGSAAIGLQCPENAGPF